MQNIEKKREQLQEKMEIAARLQSIRSAKGYTQQEMAELINLSYHTYIKLESATSGLTTTNLIKICKILGVSADLILFGETSNIEINFEEFLKCARLFSDNGIKIIEDYIEIIKRINNIDLSSSTAK